MAKGRYLRVGLAVLAVGIVAACAPVPPPSSGCAPTAGSATTLRPNHVGNSAGWKYEGIDVDACTSDDSDATFVETAVVHAAHESLHLGFTTTTVDGSTTLTPRIRIAEVVDGPTQIFARLLFNDTTTSFGAEPLAPTGIPETFTLETRSTTPLGGPLNQTAVDDIGIMVWTQGEPGSTFRVYEEYVDVG